MSQHPVIARAQAPTPRKPLDNQKKAGGDMSMMFFVHSREPKRFARPDQHHIKGLNTECIARVALPRPSWITAPEYTSLRSGPEDGSSNCGFFSLNMALYSQSVPPEWEQTWFFMYGRVHPYALTWEIEQDEGCNAGEAPQDYCIPAITIRDQSYHPITTVDDFPAMPPIVSFAGPILGSGLTLLHGHSTSGLDDTQRKCCGFIQLSSYIAPGNPNKTPFKGFHLFQDFVIFPIHANPWTTLCKRMADRSDTQFQPNIIFTGTGKVAGFLNHHIMVHPPQLTRDYVFIVVPDTWHFYDKAALESVSVSASPDAPAKQSSTDPFTFDRSKFISPSKRSAPMLKRSDPSPDWPSPITPSKKQRSSPYTEDSTQASDSTLTTTHVSRTNATAGYISPYPSMPPTAIYETSTTTTTTTTTTTESSSALDCKDRPHRSRHPPKKYLEVD